MFGKQITLFRILGISIKIDISWLFIFLLINWSLASSYFPQTYHSLSKTAYWAMGAAGALGLFGSILLHELGHCVVANRNGIPIRGISLFIFGGVSEMQEEPPTAKSEFKMAVTGPLVSFLIAIIFYLLYFYANHSGWRTPYSGTLYYLSWINALLGAFNLIPAFPLDGGRIFRSYLWNRTANLQKATRTASRVGSGFGLLLIFLGVFSLIQGNIISGIWWILIGTFLRHASEMSYQQLELRKVLQGEPIKHFMHPDPIAVPGSISVGDLVKDYIYKYHYRMFPVVRDSHLLGCVTMKRVRDVPHEEWAQHSVQELITPCSNENAVSPDTDAVQALSAMSRTGNSRLMVVDDDRLVGVVTLKDLLRFLSLKIDLEGEGHQN